MNLKMMLKKLCRMKNIWFLTQVFERLYTNDFDDLEEIRNTKVERSLPF